MSAGQLGFSIISITYDLSLHLEMSDKIAMMYSGQIVKTGQARQAYKEPHHPYTAEPHSSDWFPHTLTVT